MSWCPTSAISLRAYLFSITARKLTERAKQHVKVVDNRVLYFLQGAVFILIYQLPEHALGHLEALSPSFKLAIDDDEPTVDNVYFSRAPAIPNQPFRFHIHSWPSDSGTHSRGAHAVAPAAVRTTGASGPRRRGAPPSTRPRPGGRESPVMRPGRSPICAVSIEIRARALGKPGAQAPAASAGQIPQEEGSGPVGGCN